MNKSYKVVFSRVRGGMVVASEAASCPRKKTVKTVIAAAAAALAMGSVMAQEAPTDEGAASQSQWQDAVEDAQQVTQGFDSVDSLEAANYSYTLRDASQPTGFLSINKVGDHVFAADKSLWVTAVGKVQAHGLLANGEGVNVINAGKVYVTAGEEANSYSQKGMMADKGATVTNNGTIVAKKAYGMTVGTGGTASKIVNAGTIYVEDQGAGIELGGANDSTATNSGTINVGVPTELGGKTWAHGVLIDSNTENVTFTNTGVITVAKGASAIEVKDGASNAKVVLQGASSDVNGQIHFAEDVSGTLVADGTTDTLNLKSESADLALDVKNGANITLKDDNASTIKTVTIEGATLNASIWQKDNKFTDVTVNEGGVFNVTKLNSMVDAKADKENNRLLIAYGNKWTLNGGDLQVAETTYTGRIKIGSANNTDPAKGLGTLTISAGDYKFDTVEFGSAPDNALIVNGGTLTIANLDATYGATTITGGTLAVTKLTTAATGTVELNGGTLQTDSTQAFTLAKGETLFGETAEDVTYGAEQSTDAKTTLSTTFTATSGVLALTDEGVYTEGSLAAMSGALAGGSVSLHILKAELALEEGKTTVGLYKNVVTDQVGATETVKTVTNGTASITAANNGAQSLQVLASDEKTDVTTVELTADAATNFTLVGSQEGVNLVTTADNTPVNLTVGKNVTLKVGADVGTAATVGTFADVTIEDGAAMHVANIAAQAGTLTVGSTAAAGTDSDSTDGEAAETETVAETAEPSGATVTVGSSNSRGSLSVESLSIKAGSTVFLDPAWSGDTAVDTAANASHLSVGSIADLSGNLIVGQNSLVAVGATADAAVAGFNAMAAANTGLNWGKDGVTAALYIAKPISFGTTGKIVVDGSFDSLTAAKTAMQKYQQDYANNVTVASNGLLAVDQAALGADTAIAGSLYLENNSRVGLVNATEGVVNLATTVTVDSAATNGIEVVTDNPFISAGAIDAANGTVTTSLDAANGLGALASTGLQAMTRRADSVLASTIADRTSIDQELNAGINLWVDVRGENYQTDNFDNGGEFDADMGYGTFGGDVAFGAFTAGAAFQYGTGSLRSSVSSIKNSIDNYAFALYGTYKVTDAFKLAAELAYVWGENDISSSQAALNQSVDTEMYSFGLRAMYELKAGNFSFVPSIGLRVSQLSTDAFQVGSVKVEDQDQTLVQVPIALRINASEFDASGWSVAPSFKIAYVPTFGDKDIEVLNHTQDVIDTAPVQADFGLRIGKDNMMFNVNMLLGAGEYGTSAIGGKVGFKYAF